MSKSGSSTTPTVGKADGRTISVTGQTGEENTSFLPNGLTKDDLTDNQANILEAAVLNPGADQYRIAEISGAAQSSVSDAINKYYPEHSSCGRQDTTGLQAANDRRKRESQQPDEDANANEDKSEESIGELSQDIEENVGELIDEREALVEELNSAESENATLRQELQAKEQELEATQEKLEAKSAELETANKAIERLQGKIGEIKGTAELIKSTNPDEHAQRVVDKILGIVSND